MERHVKEIADRAQQLSIDRKRQRGERLLPEDEEFLKQHPQEESQLTEEMHTSIVERLDRELEKLQKIMKERGFPPHSISGSLTWVNSNNELFEERIENKTGDQIGEMVNSGVLRGNGLFTFFVDITF